MQSLDLLPELVSQLIVRFRIGRNEIVVNFQLDRFDEPLAGVEVEVGLLEEACTSLVADFAKHIQRACPTSS